MARIDDVEMPGKKDVVGDYSVKDIRNAHLASRRLQTAFDLGSFDDAKLRREAKQAIEFAKTALRRLDKQIEDTDDPLMLAAYALRIRAVTERASSIFSGAAPAWATIREIVEAEAAIYGQDKHRVAKRIEARILGGNPQPGGPYRGFRARHYNRIVRDMLGVTLLHVPTYYDYWSTRRRSDVERLWDDFWNALRPIDVATAHRWLPYYNLDHADKD